MKRIEEIDYIIGDLVKNDNAIVRIVKCSLYDPNPYVAAPDKNKDIGYWQANRKNIKPIPLTPAILEKNGWKKPEGFKSYWLGKIGLLYGDDGKWRVAMGNTALAIRHGVIQYVHQLQHLLFGLGLNSEMKI